MNLDTVQKSRIIFLLCFCFLLLGLLVARLYIVQITDWEEYSEKAQNNTIKFIRSPAPRGSVEDRDGKLIAYNKRTYAVNVIPEELENDPGTLKLFCEIMKINAGIYYNIIKEAKPKPGYPVRIMSDVPLDIIVRLGEQRMMLKGVSVEDTFTRYYPEKKITSHIIGYTREISKEALDKAREEGLDYKLGDYIGVSGIEKQYESELKGKDGGKRLLVNARGEVQEILKDRPHKEGNTLKLTLDIDLQKIAYEMLAGKAGALVALDPNNGEVLAMVSAPAYDPNIFTDGLKTSEWKKISSDRRHPMQNRPIGSFYPPGSVFKPIIGVSCLENKVSGLSSTAYCPGYFKLGSYRKGCWDTHGTVDFYKAIAESCDVWFYKESLKLGIDRLAETAKEFGLGCPTGIDLPGENVRRGKSGNFPTRESYRKLYKREWRKGDTLNVSIGQGDVQVSPLQMAMAVSAVANGGTLYKPHILKEVISRNDGSIYSPKTEINSVVNARKEVFDTVRNAMVNCVNNGTGRACAVEGVRVGGKTGSAQATGGIAHGWFVAFAPAENPQIAVACMVEHGGSGASSSAPICREVIKKYLMKLHIMPEN